MLVASVVHSHLDQAERTLNSDTVCTGFRSASRKRLSVASSSLARASSILADIPSAPTQDQGLGGQNGASDSSRPQ